MDKLNYCTNVCVTCWELGCKCYFPNYREIDNNMVTLLINLNKKGYKTRYHCEGHIEEDDSQIYISFSGNYTMPFLPEGFIKKPRAFVIQFHIPPYKYKKLTLEQKQAIKDEKLKALYEWESKLQPIDDIWEKFTKHKLLLEERSKRKKEMRKNNDRR